MSKSLIHSRVQYEKQCKRMDKLAALISRYAHRWGQNTSARLLGWVDAYDDGKKLLSDQMLWYAYCVDRQIDPTHNGRDLLA